MSETETITVPLSLFERSTVSGRIISRARVEFDEISLSTDAEGVVIGLAVGVAGKRVSFPLTRAQCEHLALSLAPWLGPANG